MQGPEFGADVAGAVVEQLGKPVVEGAARAEPPGVQLAFGAAAGAGIRVGEPRAGGADRGAVAGQAGQDAFGAAAGTAAVDRQRPVVAGAADVPVRPAGGEVAVPAASGAVADEPAFVLLGGGVRAVHHSGWIRARLGRIAVLSTGTGASPVAGCR